MSFEDLLLSDADQESRSHDVLAAWEERYPLNQDTLETRVLEVVRRAGGNSQRVRVRRTIKQLCDQGLRVQGPGGNVGEDENDWEVSFEVTFNWEGKIAEREEFRVRFTDGESMAGAVQQALHQQGLPVVCDLRHQLRLAQAGPSEFGVQETSLIWLILCQPPCGVWGLEQEQVIEWMNCDPQLFSDTDLIRSWIKQGFTPQEAQRWCQASSGSHHMRHPWRVLPWKDAGYTPEQVAEWADAGSMFIDYAKAQPWMGMGASPRQAVLWTRLRGYQPEAQALARPWLQAGVTDEQVEQIAERWDAHTITQLSHLLEDHSIDRVLDYGFLHPLVGGSGMASWMTSGLSAEQAREWTEVPGVYDADKAKAWMSLSLTSAEAARWAEVHDNYKWPEEVAAWLQAGLTIDEAVIWQGQGITSYAQLQQWQALDSRFSDPQEVGRMVSRGIDPHQFEYMRSFLTSDHV